VARQAEVVVRAEVDHRARRLAGRELDLDVGRLRRVDEALVLEQAGLADPRELGGVELLGGGAVGHRSRSYWCFRIRATMLSIVSNASAVASASGIVTDHFCSMNRFKETIEKESTRPPVIRAWWP
jgi:hypothetical protein